MKNKWGDFERKSGGIPNLHISELCTCITQALDSNILLSKVLYKYACQYQDILQCWSLCDLDI